MKVILVRTNHTYSIVETKGTLDDLQKLVGGWIETVRPATAYRHSMMEPGMLFIVDEDGHMKQKYTNLVGTYMYNGSYIGYPILGDIVFIGESNEDFRGLTDDEIIKLKMILRIQNCNEVEYDDKH